MYAEKQICKSFVGKIIQDLRLATKCKELLLGDYGKTCMKISTVQALSTFVEVNLSRRQFELVRHSYKTLYPSRSTLQKVKLNCYPNKDPYRIMDSYGEIQLQVFIDHTVTRLLNALDEVGEALSDEERTSLWLICK